MAILETKDGLGQIVSLEAIDGGSKFNYCVLDSAGPDYDEEEQWFEDIESAFKQYCYFLKRRFNFILEGSLREREYDR